ncbi:MAG: glycosyltransferase family 1 protein [Actinomycetota bacterium]|nr:glycosyltransferase family 1 protein [Actinomycetota bacterium]
MRVAIDATPLIGPRTGIGVFVEGLLRSIQNDGLGEVDLQIAEYTLSLKARLQGNTRGYWIPLSAATSSLVWRAFSGPKIEKFVGDIDVVHGTNFVVPPSKVPRVVSVHDLSFLNDSRRSRNSNVRFDRSVRDAVNSGATIHTISEYVAQEIQDRYSAQDVRVVYPGVQQQMANVKPPVERPTLVVIGTTDKRKGLLDLVNAFEVIAGLNKSVELQIVGPAGDAEKELDRSVKMLPSATRSRVHRVGFVEREQRDELISNATILVHPSHYEGFGFPVLEAMSMGTPVVTTTGGAIPEIAGEAALKVPPGDVDALAGALAELLANEELRSTFTSAGLDRARKFTWEATAQGMLDLYSSLL